MPSIRRLALPLLLSSLHAACLSIDGVPQSDSRLGPHTKGDAAPDAPMEPVACLDRGTYEFLGNPIRGMRQTCDGDAACIDGKCVPLPACTTGPLQECSFRPAETRGPLKGFVLQDDFVYWGEAGTTDERSNPLYDGVIARAKIGTWVREELATGLDFFDDQSRGFASIYLATSADAVLWNSTESRGYVSGLAEGPRVLKATIEIGRPCLGPSAAYRVTYGGIYMQPLDGVSDERLREEIETGGDSDCRVIAGSLYFAGLLDGTGERRVRRLPLVGDEPSMALGPNWSLDFDANSSQVFMLLANQWIGVASSVEPQDWRSLAGPGYKLSVDDTYVYWTNTWFPDRTQRFVARTRTDGAGDQEVVAEIFDGTWQGESWRSSPIQANAHGAIWSTSETDLHFVPMPPANN